MDTIEQNMSSSQERDSSPYEVEDHLAMLRETFSDTSSPILSSPLVDPTEKDTDRSGPSLSLEGAESNASNHETRESEGNEIKFHEESSLFKTFLDPEAKVPLSPIYEIDELQRSTISSSQRTFKTGNSSVPITESKTQNNQRSSRNDPSKTASKEDQPQRLAFQSTPMSRRAMSITEIESVASQNDRDPRTQGKNDTTESRTQGSISFNSGNLPSNNQRLSKTDSRGTNSSIKRSFCDVSLSKDVSEGSQKEQDSWKAELSSYLHGKKRRHLPKDTIAEASNYVKELQSNPFDPDLWLNYLRMDFHREAKPETSNFKQATEIFLDDDHLRPTLRKLYLWALQLSQGQAHQEAYQFLIRDYRQLHRIEEGSGFSILEAAYQICHGFSFSFEPRETESSTFSLGETITRASDIENELLSHIKS